MPAGEANPAVSIVLPTNDLGPFFVLALTSVLREKDVSIEVIVVLDGVGPASGTALDALDDPRVVVLALPDPVGTPRALNAGWRLARGELIARLDADDVSLPGRLARQVAYLGEHPEVAIVSSAAFLVDERGRRCGVLPGASPDTDLASTLVRRNCIVHSSVMMRRALLTSLGGYDERCLRKQDYELWLRAARSCVIRNLAQPLVEYRVHPAQNSRRRPPFASLRAVTRARLALAEQVGLPRMTSFRHAAVWLLGQLLLYAGLRRPRFELAVGSRASGRTSRHSRVRAAARVIYKRAGAERLRLGFQARQLLRRDDAVVTCRGTRIYVDRNDRRGLLLSLRHGELDREAVALWRRLVAEVQPSIAIDIGANYGEVAFSMTYPPPLRQLHLVEPNPAVLAFLARTVAMNALEDAEVRLHAGAASDRAGVRPLAVGSYSGHATLEVVSNKTVDVSTFRLDEVIRVIPADVLLFKIDVEGHEQPALEGMANLLATVPATGICEVIHADDATADYLCRHFRVSLLLGGHEMRVNAAGLRAALADLRTGGPWPYAKDAVLRSEPS